MAESDTDELQDTEITLGTGKLLVIFFGLVFLCSVFFTMGYLFGRGNAAGTTKIDIVGGEASGGSTAGKPSAVNKNGQAGPAANTATSQPAQAPASASSVPGAPAANAAHATIVPASTAPAADAQSSAPAGPVYFQVAAISKREDADALVTALERKQYPVFVATAPGDALFHVEVGPFTDPKDAEAMRTRLVNDGYVAIVKK
ncbi:MAG TPA: SPOR domain-containing protein [Candidatus Angelobacter sp.]